MDLGKRALAFQVARHLVKSLRVVEWSDNVAQFVTVNISDDIIQPEKEKIKRLYPKGQRALLKPMMRKWADI